VIGEALVLRQRPAEVDDLEAQLVEHFVAARAALLDGRSVVVEIEGPDLLGHGRAADAAVAAGLLGLVRALAIEGERQGWSINAFARGSGEEADTGRLIHGGREHLGRVPS
jgi:hypothetical protein